jgi:hypothetical protein
LALSDGRLFCAIIKLSLCSTTRGIVGQDQLYISK